MNIEKIEKNGTICAVVRSDEIVITDAQSALDLLMTAKYELGTKNIVIDKKRIKEDFFILSSGLAGDILQKMINYGGRIGVYGDYSHYTSKPLHDFIYESSKGHDVFLLQPRIKRQNVYADNFQSTNLQFKFEYRDQRRRSDRRQRHDAGDPGKQYHWQISMTTQTGGEGSPSPPLAISL